MCFNAGAFVILWEKHEKQCCPDGYKKCLFKFSLLEKAVLEKGQALTNPKPIQSQNQIGSNPAPIQDQKLSKTKSWHLKRNIWFGIALDSLFAHLGDISIRILKEFH